jgi:hypothetical protein
VSTEQIEAFVTRFTPHKNYASQKSSALNYLQTISERFPRGDVLFISKGAGDAATFQLGAQERTAKDAKDDGWRLTGYRLASRGDEKLGLTDEQIAEAQEVAASDKNSKTKKPSDFHYRVVRNKPLLMIHVLEPTDTEIARLIGQRIPAFGVSFPNGLFGAEFEIEVVANRVWLEQMYGSFEDDPDAEEDYDE